MSQIRSPSQQRSKERVDAILKAAKDIIEERGTAGLKIQDIAERAGVTAGSMYQYFPNKAAIIHALGEQCMADVTEMIRVGIRGLTTREGYGVAAKTLIHAYYQQHLKQCVWRDIMLGTAVDKSLLDLDFANSKQNAKLIFEEVKHLYANSCHPELQTYLLWLMHMSGSTVHLALNMSESEAETLIDMTADTVIQPLLSDRFPAA